MARVVTYKSLMAGRASASLKAGTNVTFSENMTAGEFELTISATGGGGGGGAPTNAKYLTLGTDATLTNERVFVPSSRLAATDGGAGGNYSLDLATTAVTPGAYTYASVTVDAYGRMTAASSGTAPVTSVTGTAGRVTSTGGTAPVIDLATAGAGASTYSYPASMTVDAYGRVTSVTGGSAPPTAHNTLSNLDWVNSGHTGVAYGVAAWNAAGAATVVNATSDETMLVRRSGVLQWVPVMLGLAFYGVETVDDGTILYLNGIVLYSGSIV